MVYPIEERSEEARNHFKQSIGGCEVSVKLIRKKNGDRLEDESLSRFELIQLRAEQE